MASGLDLLALLFKVEVQNPTATPSLSGDLDELFESRGPDAVDDGAKPLRTGKTVLTSRGSSAKATRSIGPGSPRC